MITSKFLTEFGPIRALILVFAFVTFKCEEQLIENEGRTKWAMPLVSCRLYHLTLCILMDSSF